MAAGIVSMNRSWHFPLDIPRKNPVRIWRASTVHIGVSKWLNLFIYMTHNAARSAFADPRRVGIWAKREELEIECAFYRHYLRRYEYSDYHRIVRFGTDARKKPHEIRAKCEEIDFLYLHIIRMMTG